MNSDRSRDEDVHALWQSQHSESSSEPAEMHTRIEQMEKRMRRGRYGLYIAVTGSAVVIAGMAVLFANPILLAGAALSLCGFAVLLYEVLDHQRSAPAADDGSMTSLEYHRLLLQHRLDFHRRRLWLRVVSLAPGGALFFTGLAVARPDLAPLAYLQLVTFAVAIILIVPANRKAAARLERQIEQLQHAGQGVDQSR